MYTGSGSAQGRRDFAYKTTDFAVSDLPYQGTDPLSGQDDSSPDRAYRYVPLIAGGVSFPYNLSVAGHRIRNLRLSGLTIAKIFTGAITNWSDPEIRADNNGRSLPDTPITPVVHSEGSAVSYYFGQYLAKQYPAVWNSSNSGAPSPYWEPAADSRTENGSDAVMNYLTSKDANGAIGVDEYSYALLSNDPVAKVENNAGYFVAPAAGNVGIALLRATASTDGDGLLDLSDVYSATDPRAYSLSYVSYGLIPTGSNDTETKSGTTAQRQTLAEFLYYGMCQGQTEMGPIGYTPLPINIVQADLDDLAQLKAADPNVDLTGLDLGSCQNPTFTHDDAPSDSLNSTVAQPPTCDRAGHGPCGDSVRTVNPPPVKRAHVAIAVTGAGTVRSGARRTIIVTTRTTKGPLGHSPIALYSAAAKSRWRCVRRVKTNVQGHWTTVV